MAEKELQKVRMYRNTVATEVDTDKHTDSNGLYVYSLSGDIYVGNTRIATDCETVGKTLTVNTIATKEELNVEATQRCDYLETHFTGLYETEKQERMTEDNTLWGDLSIAQSDICSLQSDLSFAQTDIGNLQSNVNDLLNVSTNSNYLLSLINVIYPVGCVMFFYGSQDPNNMYSGTTWTQLSSGYMIRTKAKSTASGTGGKDSQSITLTTANLPSHCHSLNKQNIQTGADGSGSFFAAGVYTNGGNANNAGSTSYTGSGSAFTVSTLPKYITLTAWRRTA